MGGQKNVLITGVTSTAGRLLAQQIYYDRRIGKIIGAAKEEKPYYFSEYSPSRFTYIPCDILKYRELNNLFLSNTFKMANINTVVHLAFVNKPGKHTGDTHTLNVEGTKNLIDKSIETKRITKFIFKSSIVVYKLRPEGPVILDENADLNFDPDADPWIKDRVDADMICKSRMDNPRMKIVILRFTNIIGRNITSQLNIFFDSKPCFKPLGYNPMINLIHSRDVVNAIQLAIHKDVRGVFNIGGKENAPLLTFAKLADKRVYSIPAPLLGAINWIQRKLRLTEYYYPVDADNLKFSAVVDISKAKKELGYEPKNWVRLG